ncbi:AAA family ATPase [Candidatus Woesearchaeota archaeon]|nr:AAA family ATPase [Candidatus Woesearchaeota archaeon]
MPLDYWDNATAGKTIYKFIENLNGESRLEMRKQKLIEESLALTKKQETKEKELSELKKEEAKIRKYPTESNKKQDYQISVLKPQKISDRLKEIFSLKPKIEDELNSIISNINRLKNELEYLDKQQITIKKNLETLSKIPKLQKEILIKSEDLEEILHIRDIRDSGDIRQQFYTIKDVEINSDLSEGIKTILEQLVLLKIIEQQEVENLKSDIKDASLDVLRDNLAKITHGFVGADISSLAKEAAMNVLRRILPEINLKEKEPIPKELLERLRVAEEDFKEALKIVRPSALREVLIENPNIRWADIGGLDAIKDNLREVIEWPLKYIEEFKKLGIKPPRGILLYGLPGTGKTLLAKAVATESQANFISVKGPSLINMWLGESERGIRKIFEKARQSAPTVIFFDEIDAIAPRRISGSRTTERIVNTFLSEMDGLEKLNDVIIIAATNRPDILDPALLRPGRFDKIVSVPMPDLNSRIEILKVHTSKMPMTKDVDVHKIAQITTNFTGADLEALTRESGMTALRRYISETETIKGISKERSLKKVTIKKPKLEVTSEDFEEALKNVKPSITTDDLKRYQEIEEEYVRTVRAANIKQVPQPYFG